MGGNAFKFAGLSFPRISAALYWEVRNYATAILQRHFTHVVVPSELPSKTDFGDVDFFVSGPIDPAIALSVTPSSHPTTWNLWPVVDAIKSTDGFNTPHGRKGGKNPDIMYFAVLPPGREDPDFWVQIDVKVCSDAKRFEWDVFQLRYASAAKFVGSMIKPLGLTIDNEGLYIRVQEMEDVNWEGSMVFLGDKPEDVLAVAGLDDIMVKGRFATNEELFEYLTSYWLFNPQHFAERLKDPRYVEQVEKRALWWLSFIYEWIPARFPGYCFPSGLTGEDGRHQDLAEWYSSKRSEVREKVFSMFPARVRSEYEEKKRVHLQAVEEARLRELIKAAIPEGDEGWKDTFYPIPPLLYKPAADPLDATLTKRDGNGSAFTLEINTPVSPSSSPRSDSSKDGNDTTNTSPDISASSGPGPSLPPHATPILLDSLPRDPPFQYTPRLPPKGMATDAKLSCLYRWTGFTPTGIPYILTEARSKDGFQMEWALSRASDEDLVKWAQEMWWSVWVRQGAVNFVGMWKKRFEKEDEKATGTKKIERRLARLTPALTVDLED